MPSSSPSNDQKNLSGSHRLSVERVGELRGMGLRPEESLEFAITQIPKSTLVILLNDYGYQTITARREPRRDDPESIEPQ